MRYTVKVCLHVSRVSHGQTLDGRNARDDSPVRPLFGHMVYTEGHGPNEIMTYCVFHMSWAALTFFRAVSSVKGGLMSIMMDILVYPGNRWEKKTKQSQTQDGR